MSTAILTPAGQAIAVKFYGGQARGLCLEVFIPKNLMKDVGTKMVHEVNSPNYTRPLRDYIAEVENRGGTIIFREPGIHGASSQVDQYSCGRHPR